MARPEVTDRKAVADVALAAFTIAEFCRAYRISQSMYFKMRNLGLGPREMAVGSRRLILAEAARAWRKTRERAATASAGARPGREPLAGSIRGK